MTPAQMETFRAAMNIRPGHEWDAFEGLREPPEELRAFLERVPFARGGERRIARAAASRCPTSLRSRFSRACRRRVGFGALLNEIGARHDAACRAHRHDVARRDRFDESRTAGSTAAACSRAKHWPDTFKGERIPSTFTGSSRPRASISSSASPR